MKILFKYVLLSWLLPSLLSLYLFYSLGLAYQYLVIGVLFANIDWLGNDAIGFKSKVLSAFIVGVLWFPLILEAIYEWVVDTNV